jgi:hypothetical protein
VAVAAADVDDLHALGTRANASAEAPLGSDANSTSSFGRVTGSQPPITSLTIWPAHRGSDPQPTAGAALACGVDNFESRVARDQAPASPPPRLLIPTMPTRMLRVMSL